MARLVLTEEEDALLSVIGSSTFVRARAHVTQGDLVDVRWEPTTGLARGRLRGKRSSVATAAVITDENGVVAMVEGSCTCGLRPSCAHPAALVLATMPTTGVPRPRRKARPPVWEAALSTLIGGADVAPVRAAPEQANLGLQFELIAPAASRPDAARSFRVAMRPVLPGRTGWVRGGISWSSLEYVWHGGSSRDEARWRLLREILALWTAGERRHYYGSHQQTVFLDTFSSRRIWDLLAEAQELELPLVHSGKAVRPVAVSSEPARMSVWADRFGDELVLVPTLLVDGVPLAPDCSILVGQPVHGVIWWGVRGQPAPQPGGEVLRLAPLARTLTPGMEKALAGPEIRISADHEARFFRQHYLDLVRQVDVIAADASVGLPDVGPATLTLTMNPSARHELSLGWQWVLSVGGKRQDESLWASLPVAQASERQDIVRRVAELVADRAPSLLESSPTGPRLAATATVAGDDMIRFLNDVAPQLSDMDGVDVAMSSTGSGADYRQTYEAPVISFAGADSGGHPDWFDLSVRITVDGEEVPFDELFVALAQDQTYLILPSGAYFDLDRAEFRQLKELIVEARALEDAPTGVLRVGRFQAGLWQELADLGEIAGQAGAWQRSVRSLTEAGVAVKCAVPKGLRATLRPYQRDGFRWLAALYDHGLGGVLADDMGLGKTLQALALICRVRADGGSGSGPFLVVAPTSVVHNWAVEANRFTPGLEVRTVTQTRARRGVALAEAVAGADVVVTSYTLFRLEYDEYQELAWAGLVLDEAQFVKNPHAQAYRCAKRLPAPFKLAITGTPMENNLAELWSLCSITAPGLFPRLDRFTDYYRNPIEKAHDPQRLAQLRRRIQPLMLRRKKADVVADLPDKQEQVIELELNPRHRKVYQTYLQRERQKVLGLLGDLEKHRFEIFRSLTLLRQASLDVSLVDPKHRNVPATKLDALTEQVTDLVAEGHRSLVFSQFTRFLDAARERLESVGIRCCYLDGATRRRQDVLAEFKAGTAPVFLISLKAGGFGLNLTEADYCILLDPWWNPATEAQAVDRVHRIGQTRNVMVYRLVAKDTIEEKVMALKARKAKLFSSVLDGGDFSSAHLTASDIRALLE